MLGSVLAALVAAWQSGSVDEASALIWPPSPKTAPYLSGVVICIGLFTYAVLFRVVKSNEFERVRAIKRRLLLAQMVQALKWDEDEKPADDEKDKDQEEDKDKKKDDAKQPPTAEDLFNMLYDDTEERHVTDYDIPADEYPYCAAIDLFRERLTAEFEEALRNTRKVRSRLPILGVHWQGAAVCVLSGREIRH